MDVPKAGKPVEMIEWGVIGPGRAGARFAQGLNAVENSLLKAVWGRNSDRTRSFALRFGNPHPFDSLDDLLASAIDAVNGATHPDSHAEFCLKALSDGKHVLCEKPSTLNVRQLEQVMEAAHRQDAAVSPVLPPPPKASQSRADRAGGLHSRRPRRLYSRSGLPLAFRRVGRRRHHGDRAL